MMFIMMLSSRSTRTKRIANYVCGFAFVLALFAGGEAGAQSSVQGVPNAMQGFSQNRDQPIQIESATLEMRDKKKEATFSGNVKVIQGDTTMTSKTLVVFYESSSAPAAGAPRLALPQRALRRPVRSPPRRPKELRSRPPPPVPAALRRSNGWRRKATSSSPRRIRS
jgi:lipopolysaccharide export system protein LptA